MLIIVYQGVQISLLFKCLATVESNGVCIVNVGVISVTVGSVVCTL